MDFDTHPDNFTRPDEPAPAPAEPSSPAARPVISFGPDAQPQPSSPAPPRRRRLRKALWWTLAVAAATIVAAMWVRYFNPYGVGAQECGYITSLECRGYIFKTWEGQMVVKDALADTASIYSRSFDFSVADEAVAQELLRLKSAGSEVVVTYERYFGTLPWRGEHRYMVVGAAASPAESDRSDKSDRSDSAGSEGSEGSEGSGGSEATAGSEAPEAPEAPSGSAGDGFVA